jgi:hypothetical protein
VRGAVPVGVGPVEVVVAGVLVEVVIFFSFCAFSGRCPDGSRLAACGVAHRRSMR